jgi:uncharacterized protein YhjY with autotransporter beta-barrel domain
METGQSEFAAMRDAVCPEGPEFVHRGLDSCAGGSGRRREGAGKLGSAARTTTSRVGVFNDYHNEGFFVNTSVSAGFSAYDSKRKIAFLNQTASGETQGLSYGGQVATGYDFKVGN